MLGQWGDGMRLMVSTTKGPEGQCTSEGQKRQLTLDTQVEPTDSRGPMQASTPDGLQVRRDSRPPAPAHRPSTLEDVEELTPELLKGQ